MKSKSPLFGRSPGVVYSVGELVKLMRDGAKLVQAYEHIESPSRRRDVWRIEHDGRRREVAMRAIRGVLSKKLIVAQGEHDGINPLPWTLAK